MVQLTDIEELTPMLRALDDRPQTAGRLAETLDTDPDTVEEQLACAREQGLATDWGDVWATSWRAKLRLAPQFFATWIPASLGLGAAIAALGLALNGPDEAIVPVVGLLALAAASAAIAVLAVRRVNG